MVRTTDAPLSGQVVLVVEDEFLIAADMQRIMEDAGAATVLLANSIESARAVIAEVGRIDFGVVDLKLGREDALPLINELWARGIPLIVATGFAPDLDLAGTVLLQKPFHDDQVFDAIRILLAP